MAIAKRCDVCEAYYMPYGYPNGANSITVESVDKHNELSKNIISYDLCPCCSRDILDFIDSLKDKLEE